MTHNDTPQLQPIVPRYHVRILDDEQLERLRSATLEILEEAGVHCPSDKALSIYAEHGAHVDFESQIVKLPPAVVLNTMAHAPRFYTMGARSAAHDLKLDGTAMYCATDGCGVETIDFETRQRRPSVKEDVAHMARVSDHLSSIGFYWPIVSAQDYPATAPLHELDASFNNTVKHVQTETVMDELMARYAVEMARVIAGNEATMHERPPLSSLICTIAPLAQDQGGMESALVFAEAGLPVGFMSMANTGSTAPATIAGTVVAADAEIVAAMVLIQMAYPGAPVYHSLMPGIMHPRTGASQLDMHTGRYGGSADGHGLRLALCDMARFYNLPVNLGGLSSSSYELDAQYGHEATAAGLLAHLAGADEIYSMGLLGSAQILSLDKMVLDNHLTHQIEAIIKPVLVDEEHLQAGLIERVGIGGHYLNQTETRTFTRQEYVPMWPPADKTMWEVAHAEALDILYNHQPPPLPVGAADQIEVIVAEAARALAQ